ncbi:hypothetical protein IMG5_201470 [Ichthyophthirius multifiliis]|uniref:CRAL-TRIO domain-containing protein n=1 Tax=Ichthyophthirius multifiliis TaxID=5932 RepID=G0R5Z8_ICHMU|nr:hypothetical protein IMG5_201470 [Ichthyophthirius multifiliis]EGR27122.1 hypothetical protein IMG5_201470 [Ichthyophthirius multifiliis]|eukprot:XP_004024006.1 hypothetical protein IMG5_201470 [Ichthyophthirius multifiliis]
MIVFGNKYEYLRVTKEEALSIIHPESYIQEFDGKTRKRRIFQDVPYNDFENQKLKEIEQTCFEQKLNHAVLQQKGQLLKFLYSNKFDIQKTYENLKLYIQWLMDPKTFQLNNVSKQYLEKGFAYLGGRDKQYRPSIIFDVPKMLSVELKLEEILPVFNTILWMAQEYQFYNKHIENWQLFDQISKSSTIYFPVNLENIFILHPSNSLKLSWNLVKPFIPKESQEKIQFLDGDDVKKQLLKVFNPDQLEQKYGGSVTDLMNINSSVNPYYSVQGNYNSSKGRPYDSVKYKQQNNCDPSIILNNIFFIQFKYFKSIKYTG